MWQFDLVKLDSNELIKWDAWVMSRPEGCVFYTSHWLRAITAKEPTIIAARGDYNRIIGGFAFVESEAKYGFKQVIPPAYTPYFAPVAPYNEEVEQGFIEELIDFLKPFDGMRWRPAYTNRQALLENNSVENTSALTMLLKYEAPMVKYSKSLITKLIKAQENGLTADFNVKIGEIFPLVQQSMAINNRVIPLPEPRFIQAFEELLKLELVEHIGVRSKEGELLAAGIYPRDIHRFYNLVIGTPRHSKYPEAGAFLHHLAIQRAKQLKLDFDFEGSSIAGVKHFYERFKPTEYPLKRYSYTGTTKGKIFGPLLKSVGKNLY